MPTLTATVPPARWRSWILVGGILAAGAALGLLAVLATKLDDLSAKAVEVRDAVLVGLLVLALVLVAGAVRLRHQQRQLHLMIRELDDLALTDALTGVANRRAFERELERHGKPGSGLALVLIDLDDLRGVNDRLGHRTGDAALRAAAQRIQGCLRTTDMVARLSGDEFAALLPRVGEIVDAADIAGRIVEAVGIPLGADHHHCVVGASVGVVVAGAGLEPGALVRNGHIALSAAKRQGRAGYVVYDDHLHAAEVSRITLAQDLRSALEKDQFVLHYQPIVDSSNGRVVGAEALLRWLHPDQGLIPPLDFIPLAESTGLIVPIGAWVLMEACKQAQGWQRRHPGLGDFLLTVNVSARQLVGNGLEADVVAALRQSDLDPRCLVLEIVESQMMADVDSATRQMVALNNLGVRIAIDDFGTGYSSLGYLHTFPVEFLKLDKSFTDNITDSVKSRELMRTVVQLSRKLSISTVAEGVESFAQATLLHELEVDLCQGNFYERAIEGRDFSDLLQRSRRLPEKGLIGESAHPSRRGPALLTAPDLSGAA